jgi:hypothetical protein
MNLTRGAQNTFTFFSPQGRRASTTSLQVRSNGTGGGSSGPPLGGVSGIELFETLVGETHAAAQRTIAVASCINAIGIEARQISPQSLVTLVPQVSTVMDDATRRQKAVGVPDETFAALTRFFASLGYAQALVSAYGDDAEQWGGEQAAFLHLKNLSAGWHRVSQLALAAVSSLDADIERCLPTRYAQNTAVLKQLLIDVLRGGRPCLDANGQPYIPELPQRRPAPRRVIDKPCVVEHQGKTVRAIVKDISSSGLGLERVFEMAPHKVALIEFEDGRCIAGVVIWSNGPSAGIKFDAPLNPTVALLSN